jgi:hypothetical protein
MKRIKKTKVKRPAVLTADQLISKAIAIQQRSPGAPYPSLPLCSIENRNGKDYVVLRNGDKVLYVHRLTGDKLRRINSYQWQWMMFSAQGNREKLFSLCKQTADRLGIESSTSLSVLTFDDVVYIGIGLTLGRVKVWCSENFCCPGFDKDGFIVYGNKGIPTPCFLMEQGDLQFALDTIVIDNMPDGGVITEGQPGENRE